MKIDCFFDFTCGYSFRTWRWIERLRQEDPAVEVDWRPFVLKEVNRDEAEPSLFTGPSIDSVAVAALAAGEALRGTGDIEKYRAGVFEAMHAGEARPGKDDVMGLAEDAGLDTSRFKSEESLWLEAVRSSHLNAVATWGIFGTPTLVFDDMRAMYLKLADVPDGRSLWDAVTAITTGVPELLELKRPSTEPKPTRSVGSSATTAEAR